MKNINDKKIIKIITTGGTIDKSYDEIDGQLINKESVMKERIFKKLRLPYVELIMESVLSKDSLDMTDVDREHLSQCVRNHLTNYPQVPLIILHGTDTLHLSAQYLCEHLSTPSRPVIFTGAMVPSPMEESDAWQNVGEAILAAQLVPAGIYLSFHGRIFEAPYFQKNRAKRTFEAIPKK